MKCNMCDSQEVHKVCECENMKVLMLTMLTSSRYEEAINKYNIHIHGCEQTTTKAFG